MYRVLQPERCTLFIVKSAGGTPEIEEIKTYSNCSPSGETLREVNEWIELCIASERQQIASEQSKIAEAADGMQLTAVASFQDQCW